MDAASAQDGTRTYQIAEQSLAQALREFALASNLDLLFSPDLVAGKKSASLDGKFTIDEGLRALLRGSGLEFSVSGSRVVINEAKPVTSRQATSSAPQGTNGYTLLAQAETGLPQSSVSSRASAENAQATGKERIELEEIIVTGTNIRGVYPSSSPVEIYTAEDIARTGATTTEQFIQKLPQNLGTRVQYASGSNMGNGAFNYDSVNSVDLRGLGVGTTLTLMNGRRLGASDLGQGADISLIPAGAIERVEVLTDGASALYGSDAIGGVVNFVLRRDFDGAETRINYGAASGDLRQGSFTQLFGRGWNSGQGLISYNYYDAAALETGDRDYATAGGPGTLTPDDERHNLLATFSQDVGDRFVVSGDLSFARREVQTSISDIRAAPASQTFSSYESATDQSFVNLAFDYVLTDSLNATLKGSYSEVQVDGERIVRFFNRTPQTTALINTDTEHSVLDVSATVDGALISLPAGELRFSLGAGQLREDYLGLNFNFNASQGLGREVTYTFGELFVPLVGAQQNVPFVHRLELSLAGRYTRYDDTSRPRLSQEFGDAIDPKIGLFWAPVEGFGLRGTYGTSFRAPTLTQLDLAGGTSSVFPAGIIPVAGQAASILILTPFPAGELQPETAETFTLGFDFRPVEHASFRLSGTYYSIQYEDRIGIAPAGITTFSSPQLWPDKIYRGSSPALIEEAIGFSSFTTPGFPTDRQALAEAIFALPNLWIYDNRYRNLALSEQDGFDLSVSNRFTTARGDINVGANVARIRDYRLQASATSPVVAVFDVVGQPVSMRGRAFVGWARGGFDATLSVNYADKYRNELSSGAVEPVESWTTVDLNLTCDVGSGAGMLEGVRLSLSAQNLFDEDPPFVKPSGTVQQSIGFDAANADPLGRFVVLGAAKRW